MLLICSRSEPFRLEEQLLSARGAIFLATVVGILIYIPMEAFADYPTDG